MLRVATVFGVLTGVFEVISIGIENGIPFVVRSPVLSIGGDLTGLRQTLDQALSTITSDVPWGGVIQQLWGEIFANDSR